MKAHAQWLVMGLKGDGRVREGEGRRKREKKRKGVGHKKVEEEKKSTTIRRTRGKWGIDKKGKRRIEERKRLR